ncbi:MAG TPA: hypothetical protein VGC04_15195 [Cellulomonas sp.]
MSGRIRVVGIAVGACVAVGVILLAFLWPAVTSQAKDIPVVVAGQGAQQLADELSHQTGALLDLTTVADRDAAVRAVEHRDAYGAIVLGQQPEVLIASAASPVVAQQLAAMAPMLQTQLQAQLQAQLQTAAAATGAKAAGGPAPQVTVKVTDVVPLASSDARGAGLSTAGIPLIIGALLGGILLALTARSLARRIVGLVVYVVVGGVVVTAILQSWLGILQGSWWTNAAAMALALAAVAAPIMGAVALLGTPGIPLGPVVFLLFATPIAGATAPQQFLPGAWGSVGQWFPPGATATLMRLVSYFPGADSAFGWLVLAGWTVLGLAVLVGFGRREGAPRLAGQAEPSAMEPGAEPATEPTAEPTVA